MVSKPKYTNNELEVVAARIRTRIIGEEGATIDEFVEAARSLGASNRHIIFVFEKCTRFRVSEVMFIP